MKKIIFIFAIAAITIAGLLYEPTVKNEANNDVTIENAEALACPTIAMVGCWETGGCTAGIYHSLEYQGWILIGTTLVEQ